MLRRRQGSALKAGRWFLGLTLGLWAGVAIATPQRTPLATEWQSADLLRQRCDQAMGLMQKGPPFGADQGDHSGHLLGIWMAPFFDLLAQSEQIVPLHPDPEWREAAAYCRLSLNLALTDWYNGENSDWLSAFISYPTDNAAALWQQHQLKRLYPAQWLADYPSKTKAEINATSAGFRHALDSALALQLPENCAEQQAVRPATHATKTIELALTEPARYIQFMTHAYRSECRAYAYRAYRQRGGKEARKQLNRLLAARSSFAQHMRFRNWQDYRFSQTLLSAKEARAFISTLERKLAAQLTPLLSSNYRPWDRWFRQQQARPPKPIAKQTPSAPLLEQRLRYWCRQLQISIEPINLPRWSRETVIWQLSDQQQLSFGEIYYDSGASGSLKVARLRYPVAGYQSGAMLLSADGDKPQSLQAIDSHLLMALFGLLHHPVYADYSAAPYPDLDGFEERLFSALTTENTQPVTVDERLLTEVLSAKLAIAYHQHDLSQTRFDDLNQRLLGDYLHLVDAPLASLPYSMSNLAFPDVLSYRRLWQQALAQRIAQRYRQGELTLDHLLKGLYQLRSTEARHVLISLAGAEQEIAPLSSSLASAYINP